jgi:hypothetical protein
MSNNNEGVGGGNDNNNIDDNIDAIKYLHDLYYGELNFLKTKQELLRDIIDMAPNYDIQLNAEVQLESVTASLKKLEGLQEAVSLIQAFDTIKKQQQQQHQESSINK